MLALERCQRVALEDFSSLLLGGATVARKECPICEGRGKYKVIERCPKCSGDGKVTCPDCHGEGGSWSPGPGAGGQVWVTCPTCEGDRRVRCTDCEGRGYIERWETCSTCHGTGVVEVPDEAAREVF